MDLSQYLHELLHHHDYIVLPRIGSFTLQYKPASVDFVKHLVLPAAKFVHFSPQNAGEELQLVECLSPYLAMDKVQIEAQVNAYIEQVEMALLQHKTVHFPCIGQLCFNTRQELEFTPDNTNFLLESFGLEAVECYPIQRNKQTIIANPELLGVGSSVFVAKKAWWKNRVVAAAALVLLIVIAIPIGLWIFQDNHQQPDNNNTLAAILDSSQNAINTDTLVQKEDSTPKMQNLASLPTDTVIADTIPTEKEPETDNFIVSENPDKPGSFIVIVGAFAQPPNAERMLKLLNEAGFFTHTDQTSQGLQRVGVRLDCAKEQLPEQLKELRRKFNSKAWIL